VQDEGEHTPIGVERRLPEIAQVSLYHSGLL
jgi:hypothetical protein